jgi:pilus assembly protein FimV
MAGLFPVWVGALGLGEAETRSALNQPLAVEIPVISVTSAELEALSVALASPETFERYGLPLPSGLGDINFSVTPSAGGGLIRITSARAVVEPFVTLLLDVRWSQGRLLREYTVLLDPPAFAGGTVQQPVTAPERQAPIAPAIERSGVPEPAPATTPDLVPGGEQVHTVASRETLWGIASQYRPDTSVDMNQMMLAIYRANPEAFAGNINRLRAGAVLRIPAPGALETPGAREASAEIRRQNEAWQAAAPPREPESARLQLVPPQESQQPEAAVSAPATSAAQDVGSELEQSRRLLAIRDAELAALRQQLADLKAREAAGDVAVTPPPAGTTEAELPDASPPAEPVAAAPASPPQPAVLRSAPPKADTSWLDSIGSMLRSVWLWVGLGAVLLAALVLTRRRSLAQTSRRWSPQLAGAAASGGPANISIDDDEGMVVEESMRPVSAGAFERKPTPAPPEPDEELPLERTISTEGPVNLDQTDPLAEADFHMAYGLYDQAADLLNSAIRAEPARRDLRMKLLDVYFVWENREGFLETARGLRERIPGDSDPDWKRVVLMGRQLCPSDPMFSGTPSATAADMDVPLSADSGMDVDVPFVEEAGELDFDLSEADSPHAFDSDTHEAATQVARPSWATGRGGEGTVETPTVKSVAPGGTVEAPTIEARASGSSTIETPTIESPLGGSSTVETPTVEAWSPDLGGTAKVTALSPPPEPAEQTAEIDLDELGLDLTGLDDAARDIATGLHEALPGSAEHIDLGVSDADFGSAELESTAEMGEMAQTESSQPLERLTTAIQKGKEEETAEQPAPGLGSKSATIRAINEEALDGLDADLATGDESQATATGLRALRPRAAEDPTMTEVGTKLDLARAYLDMGDPDGARSILNEVLEEGDTAQRQEARQLLDTLGD